MNIYYNSETQFYNCKWCNKKYKRDSKLADHIETTHPFARLHSNRFQLSKEERENIINLLKDYCQLLEEVFQNTNVSHFHKDQLDNHVKGYFNGDLLNEFNLMYRFIHASHMLLPVTYKQWIDTNNNDTNNESNLLRMIENHLFFLHRVNASSLLSKVISQTPDETNQLELLLKEFESFLNLGMTWRNDNFCPSLVVDLIWHASMMNNSMYMVMCNRFFKTPLSHCLPENEEKSWDKDHHEKRYSEFERHFSECHSRPPLKIDDLVLGTENAFDVYKKMEEKRIADEKMRILYLERLQREKEDKRRIEHQAYLKMREEEERIKREYNENYFKQHGSYPSYKRPSWDDGKC
jgi:hypothetical protein